MLQLTLSALQHPRILDFYNFHFNQDTLFLQDI
jgi:hypothetical protein